MTPGSGLQYQTFLYKAVFTGEQFGWDYGIVIFKSALHSNATDAMVEFNNYPITEPHWMATMQELENGEVLDEQLFDSSVLSEA